MKKDEIDYAIDIEEEKESSEQFIKSRDFFLQADVLNFENKKDEAERLYRKSIKATNDKGVYYHLSRGQIYAMQNKIDEALTEFEIALSINDQIEEVHINLGLTYRKISGRLSSYNMADRAGEMIKESLASFEKALTINKNSINAILTKAPTLIKLGRMSEAKDCAEKTLAIDPKNYMALTTMSIVLRSQKDIAGARAYALKAIEVNPTIGFAYGLMGAKEDYKKGPALEPKPIKAIDWLNKAMERDSENIHLYTDMAKAYEKLGNYEEAIKWYDKIIQARGSSEDYGSHGNRGNAYIKLGKLDEAEKDLLQALSIRPNFSFAIVAMRNLRAKQKKFEEAYEYAMQAYASKNTPDNFRPLKELEKLFYTDRQNSNTITEKLSAITFNEETNFDQVIKRAQEALALFSGNSEAWGIIGRCYCWKNKPEEGKVYIQKALALDPKASFYRSILASIMEKAKDYKGAEREYKVALEQSPRDSFVSDGLERVRIILRKLEAPKKFELLKEHKIVFLNNKTGREEEHSIELIRQFLNDRIEGWRLPIKEIINEIGNEPVFIIAKTGVGKTVTVPTKVLLGLCSKLIEKGETINKKFPQVYVVEPRIPICTMMMAEMNKGYQDYLAYRMTDYRPFAEYLKKNGIGDISSKEAKIAERITCLAYQFAKDGLAPYDPRNFNLYGCITSASGKVNASAPILFITTGIMESLTFEGDKLNAAYNRIIIDEAHVTIEQNPAIELGIALAKKAGVQIDYMSATVDKATLAQDLGVKIVFAGEKRYPIYLSNLGVKLEEKVLDLVENLLVDPNPAYFPEEKSFVNPKLQNDVKRIRKHLLTKEDFDDEGKRFKGLNNRAQGLLIIVNSHLSEASDTRRIADMIAEAGFQSKQKVYTLRLASPVVRDPQQKLVFDRFIEKIEKENGRYVIVATNVVEMGLTFSSIDYVITMDSEFDTVFVDKAQMTKKVALGVNALYQRIGRCGRVRPGMAFIAKDFGADYTTKSAEELTLGLKEAPIHYPIAKGSFQKLALYTFRESLPEANLRGEIKKLNLPSRIQENEKLWQRFKNERQRLRDIGIAQGDSLTSAGKKALTFIGLEDLDFARLLAEAVERHGSNSDIAIVLTLMAAAAEFSFSDFLNRDFALENPHMLSAYSLINEELFDGKFEEVRKVITENNNNAEKIYQALLKMEIDNQVNADIMFLIQDGYNLVEDDKKNGDKEQAGGENTNGVEPEKENGSASTKENNYDREFLDPLDEKFEEYSKSRALVFEKAAFSFNSQTELINIWKLYHYFFNKYFSRLRSSTFNSIEGYEFKKMVEKEAEKLQVLTRPLYELNKRFLELCKHLKIKLPLIESRAETEYSLKRDDYDLLAESCLMQLLYERIGDTNDFDLCLQFFKLTKNEEAKINFEKITSDLNEAGFEVDSRKVKELWFMIVREAKKRFKEASESFSMSGLREELPTMTKKVEKQILELIHEIGYHRKLTLKKLEAGGYGTKIKDELGANFDIVFNSENSPLGVNFTGEEVKIMVKLTPKMVSKTRQSEDAENPGFIQTEEKGFKMSHITVL